MAQKSIAMEEYVGQRSITVTKGEEYLAREEDIYQESTYFAHAYQRAGHCLNEILKYAEELERGGLLSGPEQETSSQEAKRLSHADLDGVTDGMLNSVLLQWPSNIMTFCADRGQGKTTAMVSFARALQKLHDGSDEEQGKKRKFWREMQVMGYHFDVITSIDPTSMEEHDSILKVILSRMFSHFLDVCEEKSHAGLGQRYNAIDLEHRRMDLARLFQKCFHDLNVLRSDKGAAEFDMEDELERIVELGDSTNLRGSLYRLINKYLEFVLPHKSSVLVLQIDDADLNVDKVYSILEDIRKYLHLPRVVILMAANVQQMEVTVEQYFLNKYAISLKEKSSLVDVERCQRIAEQYLEKLLPKPMRIYLPELDLGGEALQEDETGIHVIYQDKQGDKEINILDCGNAGATEKWPYQRQLLYFLHRKTGILYLSPTTYLHNLIPATMRELTHFLAYFGPMENVDVTYQDIISYRLGEKPDEERTLDDVKKQLEGWRSNLNLLEDYLRHLWPSVNLRKEGRQHFQTFMTRPPESRHRYLLHVLPDYYARERLAREHNQESDRQAYRQQFIAECEKRGVFLNDDSARVGKNGDPAYQSYADVITALNVLTDLPGGSRQYKFAYAVAFYYSIYTHKLLLDQVLYKSKEIPELFGDILFRQGRRGSMEEPVAFWHIPVKAEDLQTYFSTAEPAPNQQSLRLLSRNLRLEREGALCYTTRPVEFISLGSSGGSDPSARVLDLQSVSGETLIFSPFYFLWFELRQLLAGFNEAEQGYYMKNAPGAKETRGRIEIALVVLLNWDVQKELFHQYKQPDTKRDNTFGLADAVRDILGAIGAIDLQKVNNLKLGDVTKAVFIPPQLAELEKGAVNSIWTDDEIIQQKYDQLQLCMAEGRIRLLNRYIAIANEQIRRLRGLSISVRLNRRLRATDDSNNDLRTRTINSSLPIQEKMGQLRVANEALRIIVDQMSDMRTRREFSSLCKKIAEYGPSQNVQSESEETGFTVLILNAEGEDRKNREQGIRITTETSSANTVIEEAQRAMEKYSKILQDILDIIQSNSVQTEEGQGAPMGENAGQEELKDEVLKKALSVLTLFEENLRNRRESAEISGQE